MHCVCQCNRGYVRDRGRTARTNSQIVKNIISKHEITKLKCLKNKGSGQKQIQE